MRNNILKQVDNYNINDFDGYTLHKGLKNINKYYYIENKSINYNNSYPRYEEKIYNKLYNSTIDFFDNDDKIFLYELSICRSGDILNIVERTNIDEIVKKIKKDKSFHVSLQKLTQEQKLFLDNIEQYIFDYCEQSNLKILKTSYNNHNFDCWSNKEEYFTCQPLFVLISPNLI